MLFKLEIYRIHKLGSGWIYLIYKIRTWPDPDQSKKLSDPDVDLGF